MQDRPNVLLIMSDQHNPLVTGCYGDSVVQTPTLDGLAAGGALFENAYCTSPICAPSRMSILTGQHPYVNEVWDNPHVMNSAVPTMAHALGAEGYDCSLIGKLHAMGQDQLLGFRDRQLGDHGVAYPGAESPARGELGPTAGPTRLSLSATGPGATAYQLRDELVASAAVEYFERRRSERDAGLETQPFFLSLGFMLPHPPYIAKKEDYERYVGQVPPPETAALETPHAWIDWWRQQTQSTDISPEEVNRARTAYWALVDRFDQIIARPLEALRRCGFERETLVVYTSDHGDQLGEQGLWWKHTMLDGSVKVPGILSWPGVIPAGQRVDRVVSTIDLTATILDAAGAPPLPGAGGGSLLPLLTGGSTEWPDVAFAEYSTPHGHLQRMVRYGDWKLIYHHGMAPQLFDLRSDPDEVVDLSQDPTHAERVRSLLALLEDDWDPAEIAGRVTRKYEQTDLLRRWGRAVRPPQQYRWPMSPEMTRLDP